MAAGITISAIRATNDLLPTAGGGKTNSKFDSSIGAPVTFEFDVTLTDMVVAGTTFRLRPCLFNANPELVPIDDGTGWVTTVPSDAVTNDEFAMSVYTGTGYALNQQNLSCRIKVTASTTATIFLSTIMTMDIGWMSGASLTNVDRLLKSHKNDPFVLTTANPSVYTHRRHTLSALVFATDGTDSVSDRDDSDYKSRFYASGIGTDVIPPASGEMALNPTIVLKRGGVTVNNLSAYEKTTVELSFQEGAAYTIGTKVRVYLLKTSPVGNAGTFQTTYENVGVDITDAATEDQNFGYNTYGVAGTFDVVAGTPNYNRVRFKIGTFVQQDAEYAIAVVVAGELTAGTDNTFTNSFIRVKIAADGTPPPLTMTADDFEGTVVDYNADPELDNVVSTVVDELLAKVRVRFSTYDTAASSALFGTTWDADVTRIKVTLEDFTSGEVFAVREFTGAALTWTGTSSNNLTATTPEAGVHEYAIQVHGCFPNDAGFPDFTNKDVRVKWEFRIDYPFLSWSVVYRYDQKIHFNGYRSFAQVIQSIEFFAYDTGLPLTSLCDAEQVLVLVKLNPSMVGSDEWNIRVGWTLEPHGFNGNANARPAEVNQEQTYAGQFPALDTPAFINVPAVFDADNQALFIFDHETVPVGGRPRIHVIAEPVNVEEVGCCTEDPLVVSSNYPGPVGGPIDDIVWAINGENEGRPIFQDAPPMGLYYMYYFSGFWVIEDAQLGETIFQHEGVEMLPCEIDPGAWEYVGVTEVGPYVINSICGQVIEACVPCAPINANGFNFVVPGFRDYYFQWSTDASLCPGYLFGGTRYRVNGGPWIWIPFVGYGNTSTIPSLPSGATLEIDQFNALDPECTLSISQIVPT